jgi:hypothetical protein
VLQKGRKMGRNRMSDFIGGFSAQQRVLSRAMLSMSRKKTCLSLSPTPDMLFEGDQITISSEVVKSAAISQAVCRLPL